MRRDPWDYEERGVYVAWTGAGWTVFKPTPSGTHAVSDSTYDDKPLAIMRALYLARGPGRWAREATAIAKGGV